MKPLLALLWGGGLVFVIWLFAGVEERPADISALSSACSQQGPAEELMWQHVHDGDTLALEDGRRVRVLGINTPELASRGRNEPLATEASRAAAAFLDASSTLVIQAGPESTDRYGRLLAHVFRSSDGASLAEHLLARGLAWQVAVPPNLAYLDCYRAAEAAAEAAEMGVWSGEYLADAFARQLQPGFRVLHARIVDISLGKTWWLETDAGFVIQVRGTDQAWFQRGAVEGWRGQDVEVRGWMYHRGGSAATRRGHQPWVLNLRHPSGLRLAVKH